jgi:hypothetical protein
MSYENPAEELQREITDALQRVVDGTATREDARRLCYACGTNPADVGIGLRHRVRHVPLTEVQLGTL